MSQGTAHKGLSDSGTQAHTQKLFCPNLYFLKEISVEERPRTRPSCVLWNAPTQANRWSHLNVSSLAPWRRRQAALKIRRRSRARGAEPGALSPALLPRAPPAARRPPRGGQTPRPRPGVWRFLQASYSSSGIKLHHVPDICLNIKDQVGRLRQGDQAGRRPAGPQARGTPRGLVGQPHRRSYFTRSGHNPMPQEVVTDIDFCVLKNKQ